MKNRFFAYLKVAFICILSLLCLSSAVADDGQQPQRKKVALVLSGGGAKGAAHVGAIKVIEEAGIPIDYIVGTSMGSIIGGMYAYGYTTQQLDSILRAQDWMSLLLNSTDRDKKDYQTREFDEKFMVTVPFMRDNANHLYGGVLSGESVLDLLYALTPEHADSMDFNNLDIPFACVVVDVLKNKELQFHSGILAECIRASMSIPAVFSPVRKDGMVLIDGGMANNFPVDVAKEMGADVIIGVTLEQEVGEKTADDLTSTVDIVSQLLSNATHNKIEENKEMTDILINVDTKGYSAASFSTSAICDLIDRGERDAREVMPDLLELKEYIGISNEDTVKRNAINVPLESAKVAGAAKPKERGCTLGAGFRIDNEELASILLGAKYVFNSELDPMVGADVRLGKRSYAHLVGSFSPFGNWTFEGGYKFSYNENKLYKNGERIVDWDYHEHNGNLSFYRTWKYMKLSFSADYILRKFDHVLSTYLITGARNEWSALNISYDEEKNINYNVSAQYDNRDANVFPHKGSLWRVGYTFKTDDGSHYENKNGLSVLEAYFEHNCPLTERFTLVPAIWGRFIGTPDHYRLGDRNVIGGYGTWGHYLPQQVPFAGINHFEVIDDKLAAAGATLRYRIGVNHHVFAVGNYGRSSRYIDDIFSQNELVGAALGYGYKTPIGPIDLNFNWSNVTEKVGIWLNFGYMF